jgi:hypothetical protein
MPFLQVLGHYQSLEAGMFSLKTFKYSGGAMGRFNESVQYTTIDSLQLDQCRLIKVDVEGVEWEVVHGAVDTIRRCDASMCDASIMIQHQYINHDPTPRNTSTSSLSNTSTSYFDACIFSPPRCRPMLYLEHNGHAHEESTGEGRNLVELIKSLGYQIYYHQFHTRLSR